MTLNYEKIPLVTAKRRKKVCTVHTGTSMLTAACQAPRAHWVTLNFEKESPETEREREEILGKSLQTSSGFEQS